MVKRIGLSGQHLCLDEISSHYSDVEKSLRSYYSDVEKYIQTVIFSDLTGYEKFFGYSLYDIRKELDDRLEEESRLVSLSVLSALEAAFRIDYLQRVYRKKKDPLSRNFRQVYQIKRNSPALENDIFNCWSQYSNLDSQIFSDLKSAFKYRHWLAHGRYWQPKFGRGYDYNTIYSLAEDVFNL